MSIPKETIEELAGFVALLRQYEAWEGKLLLTDECWTDGLPRMNQELYNNWMELQAVRNSLLAPYRKT